jgi:hypothetical protein
VVLGHVVAPEAGSIACRRDLQPMIVLAAQLPTGIVEMVEYPDLCSSRIAT